jgi:hypothetical protein
MILDGVMAKMSEHRISMEAVSGSPLAASRSSALEELFARRSRHFRENEVADSLYIALIGCLSVMCGKTTAATFWLRDTLAISDRRR